MSSFNTEADAMRRRTLLLLILIIGVALGAEPRMSIRPELFIPLGPQNHYGNPIYTVGWGLGLDTSFPLNAMPGLSVIAAAGYESIPLTISGLTLSAVTLGGGAGIELHPLPSLAVGGSLRAGGYLAMLADTVGVNPFGQACIDATWRLAPGFAVGARASMLGLFEISSGGFLGYGLGASLLATISLGKNTAPQVRPGEPVFDPLFPVFFKYYDTHPLGTVDFVNTAGVALSNIRVSFVAKDLMDGPKTCATIDALAPKAQVKIPLYALFNEKILEITEQTKVTCEIIAEYDSPDGNGASSRTASLRVLDRNSLTWTDDRRAAAFVTAKDPTVLRLMKPVAGMARATSLRAVDLPFRIGMAVFDALGRMGLSYVKDPETSFTDAYSNKSTIDFIQFPRQTLEYRSGDCDDLSVLLCAALEAVGLEAAFITVPGHIFAAFALEAVPDELSRTLSTMDNIAVIGGKAWVPLEATMFGSSFVRAWQEGARQWRGNEAERALIPVREAWNEFEAVGIRGEGSQVMAPDEAGTTKLYMSELQAFIEREITPKVASFQASLKASPKDRKAANGLGALYARYGVYDKAEEYFTLAAKDEGYAPAFVNLGQLALRAKDYTKAEAIFKKVLTIDQSSAFALAGLGVIAYEGGDHALASSYYIRCERIDKSLAKRFAYLASTENKAASGDISEAWMD